LLNGDVAILGRSGVIARAPNWIDQILFSNGHSADQEGSASPTSECEVQAEHRAKRESKSSLEIVERIGQRLEALGGGAETHGEEGNGRLDHTESW
jgi:hypothetical protein